MSSKQITQSAVEAAYRRREARLASEPLAVGVRYDRVGDTVVVEMNNGAVLVIPRGLMQGLSSASDEQLQQGTVAGHGTALRWPDLDADFTLLSLLGGVYGGKRWMSELARRAGSRTSKAKAVAARRNGAKGGRPRKAS
ncbi:MAG: DUF2442 domain-containing protein [Vulcanimicrobiaceae bacterium]|jgi:hypothetical protein